jgi:hypothetical protein
MEAHVLAREVHEVTWQQLLGVNNGLTVTPDRHHITLLNIGVQTRGPPEKSQHIKHQINISGIRLQEQDYIIRIERDTVSQLT